MAQFGVENGNANAGYNDLFGNNVGRSIGNRSINALDADAAGDSFVLVNRHEFRQGVVTMGVVVSGGAYSALSVALQARQQGGSWVTLATMSDPLGGTVSADIEGFDEFRALHNSGTTSSGIPVITVDLTFN